LSSPTDTQAFKLRPRFDIHTQLTVLEVCDEFKKSYESDNPPFSGKVRGGYVCIYPLNKERHYWSPYFSLSIESVKNETYATKISVLYGPAPEVWTMFVFFYAVIALLIVIVAVIGFANKSIGEPATILWTIPLLLVIFISMYAVSYYGQKKGHNQVEEIYDYMSTIISIHN